MATNPKWKVTRRRYDKEAVLILALAETKAIKLLSVGVYGIIEMRAVCSDSYGRPSWYHFPVRKDEWLEHSSICRDYELSVNQGSRQRELAYQQPDQ
jgi:hypothetical protein